MNELQRCLKNSPGYTGSVKNENSSLFFIICSGSKVCFCRKSNCLSCSFLLFVSLKLSCYNISIFSFIPSEILELHLSCSLLKSISPKRNVQRQIKLSNHISQFPSSGKTEKTEQFKENGNINGNYTASIAAFFCSETISLIL